MDQVQSADQAFHLSSGDAVPIRQRELKRIRERYLNYLSGKGRPAVRPE